MIIVLAGLLAVAGTLAVVAYAHHANERAIAGEKPVTVFVAQKAIPTGTKASSALTDGELVSQQEAASNVPSNAVHSISGALATRFISTALAPGEMLLTPMLVTSAQETGSGSGTGGLSPPAGQEYVTIQLCLSEAVGGHLTVGSWVAVYQTAPKYSGANLTRTCSVQHPAVVPGSANTVELPLLHKVKVVSVSLGANSQSTTPGITSVLADPASSASLLSTGAVAVTFQVTNSQAIQLITDAQVEMPYLALLPAS